MPAKIDDAENLRFLFACFQSVEPLRVDYAKVASQFGIQSAAARMRLLRLKEALGGKEIPKEGRNVDPKDGYKKPRKGKKAAAKEGLETNFMGMGKPEDDDDEVIMVGGGAKKEEINLEPDWKSLPEAKMPLSPVVKQESRYGMDGYGATAGASPPYHEPFSYQASMHPQATDRKPISFTSYFPPQPAAPQSMKFESAPVTIKSEQKELQPAPSPFQTGVVTKWEDEDIDIKF